MSMPSSYDVPITDSIYVLLILSHEIFLNACLFQDIQMSQQGANYHMFANMIIYLPFFLRKTVFMCSQPLHVYYKTNKDT